jgi:hypothetical protein
LEEREEERKEKWALMQEPALARAPRHFERVKGGSCMDKVVLLYSPIVHASYKMAIDNIAIGL